MLRVSPTFASTLLRSMASWSTNSKAKQVEKTKMEIHFLSECFSRLASADDKIYSNIVQPCYHFQIQPIYFHNLNFATASVFASKAQSPQQQFFKTLKRSVPCCSSLQQPLTSLASHRVDKTCRAQSRCNMNNYTILTLRLQRIKS